VREGEALRRIGISAELFDDHSPLQLGASGRYQGSAFTLVGRLQYGYAEGTWNEWHALFDSGKSGWLSEDNGAYVVAFDTPLSGEAPRAAELSAGERRLVHGSAWSVASVTRARLIAAQGELPTAPRPDGAEFTVADLRNEQGEVGTLDYSDPAGAVTWSIGRAIRLADLGLSGLREASEKTLGGKGFECPNCGASLELKLATTQSIACHQCKSVIDVSKGIGADLSHYAQTNSGHDGAEPQIPLGSTGRLALDGPETEWQVVGYQERCDIPTDDDEEQTFWREYLLFHRTEGFVFLVDSEDGWSWAKPLTGVPQVRGDTATWQGKAYNQRESYSAKVTWVLGEFYWRVRREERAAVTDFHGTRSASSRRLSREQTGNEVTWSEGATLSTEQLARAFSLAPGAGSALRRDVATLSRHSIDSGLAKALLVVAVVLVVLAAGFCTSRDNDCAQIRAAFGEASNEYQQCLRGARSGSGFRSGGGSFGGYSSGGGHK